MPKVKPIPDGFHTITPALVIKDAITANLVAVLAFVVEALVEDEAFPRQVPFNDLAVFSLGALDE